MYCRKRNTRSRTQKKTLSIVYLYKKFLKAQPEDGYIERSRSI